jgi:hypothetical protein
MPTRITLFVFFLTASAFVLGVYNLNWGAPFYFHPDERNIASSVSQLQFPEHMNPKFFAYGSLPIYSIFFTGLLADILSSCQLLWVSCEESSIPFHEAIQVSRLYSTLFSTILVPLLFFIGKRIKDETTGLFAAMFAATSVGFIQFAHFGTFEMWLTLFSMLLFWCCVEIARKKSYFYLIWAGLVFGVLIATKVSSVALLPLPLLAIFMRTIPNPREKKLKAFLFMRGLSHTAKDLLLFTLLALSLYLITNPYTQLDQKGFADSMHYETGVATGSIPVFYTAEFYDAMPLVFQLYHVYPFLLNPFVWLLALPSLFYIFFFAKKTKQSPYLLLVLFFITTLLSQAPLFVKWTRYMVPTLPFLYLMLALTLADVFATYKTHFPRLNQLSLSVIMAINLVFALSYVITAFIHTDTRVAAEAFAKQTIPKESYIVSEVYDLGIVPFNSDFPQIQLFNFYDLDLDPNSLQSNDVMLQDALTKAQYIILPSQRVIKSRLLQPKRFPKANKFYTQLFNGSLGFEKIYETPCDIFCQITYLGSPSFRYEQTANVFDRPTVYIFKKK